MRLPRKDGLNIVPFIDIMLVLLAITLSVSTFIAQGLIKIDLPSSNMATKPSEQRKIVIKVDENSQIFIDEKASNIDELKLHLSDISKTDLVLLQNDKNSKFEVFVSIVDVLKEINHENFAIATTKEK